MKVRRNQACSLLLFACLTSQQLYAREPVADGPALKAAEGWVIDPCTWGGAGYTWVGDFDGNGLDDIASSNHGEVYVHLTTLDGFDSQTWNVPDLWGGPDWTWAADFNGDGKDDIASSHYGEVYMYLSTGVGFDSQTWTVSDLWGGSEWTWVADFNGDGKADIASANYGEVYMKMSTGKGFRSETWNVPNQWGGPDYTWIGDFNNDGRADIASSDYSSVYVHLSTGRKFDSKDWVVDGGWGHSAFIRVGDFNGDGNADIASPHDDLVFMRLSSGDGFDFDTWHVGDHWGAAEHTWVGDFDGDGFDDLASADFGDIHLLRSEGHGFSHTIKKVSAIWGDPKFTWVGDFTGDGKTGIASAKECYVYMKLNQPLEPVDLSSAESIESAVLKYSPVVYFHTDESYFTDSVEYVLAKADLVAGVVANEGDHDQFRIDHRTIAQDWRTEGLATSSEGLRDEVAAEADVPREAVNTWLEIKGNKPREGLIERTKVYVVLDLNRWTERLTIQYWYFFPYNGPGRVEICASSKLCLQRHLTTNGRHEGDWENVSVEVEPRTGFVTNLYLSEHGSQMERVAFVEWRYGSHPVVYSGKFSHAFYPQPGKKNYKRIFSKDYGLGTASVDLYDLANTGRSWRTRNSEDIQIIKSNIDEYPVMRPNWLDFTGRWGGYEQLSSTISVGPFEHTEKEVGAGPYRNWAD